MGAVAVSAISVFLVALSVIITPSFSLDPPLTNEKLNRICSATVDPAFCQKTLSGGVSTLKSAVKRSHNLAASQTRKNVALIQTLFPRAASALAGRYARCLKYYNSAAGNLGQAAARLTTRNYLMISKVAANAVSDIELCTGEFDVPPLEPSSFLNDSQLAIKYCSILSAAANFAGKAN